MFSKESSRRQTAARAGNPRAKRHSHSTNRGKGEVGANPDQNAGSKAASGTGTAQHTCSPARPAAQSDRLRSLSPQDASDTHLRTARRWCITAAWPMWLANCSPQGQPHAARICILATEAPNTAAHQGQPHAACHRKTPNFRVSDIRTSHLCPWGARGQAWGMMVPGYR